MAYKIHIKGESPMKASELIKKLQEMVEQHGDLDVCYEDTEGWLGEPDADKVIITEGRFKIQ